jgi:thiol-disulfide isomerase/thioredoxin
MRRFLGPLPLVVVLGVVALLGVLTYGVTSSGHSDTIDNALAEGRRVPAPALTLPPLVTHAPTSLSDYRGQVVVLNFWASWCVPCRQEQEGLELAHKELARRGVRLIGVNIRDDRGAATSYLEEFQVGYPSLVDRPAVLPARLGALGPQLGPPYTLVVDAEGQVVASVVGVLPGSQPERQAALLTDLVERVT